MAGLSEDEAVRAVVLAARGPHFSVGLDLKAMGHLLSAGEPANGPAVPSVAARTQRARAEILRLQAAITAVAECPKPVVAAVHGYCIGGGVDLIAACDIRLASVDAVFSVREAKTGHRGRPGQPAAPARHHRGRARRRTGLHRQGRRRRSGPRAGPGQRGLRRRQEAALAAARALADEIAANSPLAVQGTKAILAANDGRTVAEGLDYVATWNAGMLASDDLTEAVTAFMEKRAPRFTGR